jgi:hypothetical protein
MPLSPYIPTHSSYRTYKIQKIDVVIGAGSALALPGYYYTTCPVEKMLYDDAARRVSMASCYIEA